MFRYNHPKLRIFLIIVAVCCLIGVFLYEPIKSELVTSYHPNLEAKPKGRLYRPVSYNLNRVKPVTMHEVINARLHAKNMRVAGQIIDPSAKMRLPVGLGVNSNTLMLAAGTMRPKERMGQGNFALAGHHMLNHKALFTPLYYHAKPGQMVYLANRHNIYSYELTKRKVVSNKDVRVVDNTRRPIITLVTCNSGRLTKKRLVLQGQFKHRYPIKNASNTVKKTLAGKTNNYQVLKGY